jgi:DNA primase
MSNIESVLRELGIDYKLSGDEAIARCPSHSDRHPSWSCNTSTGIHHCFSCGFSGNLASLAAKLLNLSYAEAVIWCNERVGWSKVHQWREDYEGANFSPSYMHISEVDTALFTKVPQEQLTLKGITEEAAEKFGILWNPKDKTWIFPVRDPFTNELWGWQSKNSKRFRHYPAGIQRSKTLFGMGAFSDGGRAILVESPIDCAYLYAAGISGGLSSFGVRVSNYQFSLVQRVSESLVLALDNDNAGVAETARICNELGKVRSLRVFNYGSVKAKDVGEMSYEEVRQGIDNAIPAMRWARVHRKTR